MRIGTTIENGERERELGAKMRTRINEKEREGKRKGNLLDDDTAERSVGASHDGDAKRGADLIFISGCNILV